MKKFFETASFVGSVIAAICALFWFIAQAKHFLNAPDGGVFLFGVGLAIVVLCCLLVKISYKELK